MPKFKDSVRRVLVEERQGQILSAAMKVFAKKGFDRSTIADIAGEAGIAEGSIYNYFKNKDDLLAHIPRLLLQPALQTLDELMEPPGPDVSPEQALTQIGRYIVSFFVENAPFVRVMFSSLPSMNVATRTAFIEQGILYVASQLETVFAHMAAQGVLRTDLDPTMVPRMFVGLLIPTLLFKEIGQAPSLAGVDYEQVIANAVSLFLYGALADGPAAAYSGAEKKGRRRKQA